MRPAHLSKNSNTGGTYLVPGVVLGNYMMNSLNLHTAVRHGCCDHLVSEERESQRGLSDLPKVTEPGSGRDGSRT